ncbi:MAG: bifunctional UDP-N-acetylmuramoyl-tripeptide:D-alanyl-D-alanine ligase/alanine racemase [Chitinophagales bacterium]|nr:bifunctional UDP-N-acetylmuramoyl-tripeptide:D-alanyl-D-alanine ligase/alanine racemase [Chitinophagales bacterium]
MSYSIQHIAAVIGADAAIIADMPVGQLILDSRKVYAASSSLFFAIKGPRRDGHQFISELYKKGVRNFVISTPVDHSIFPAANFLLVKDTLQALQELAAYHRKQFTIPVIGITGSNGKTIVKEWLYQLLQEDQQVVRSPRSYNSQVGVPLSVWQINKQHTLGIFEAGVSQAGEMEQLEKIIQPTIGVLTNIGEAHSEGFTGKKQKLEEKLKLFSHAEVLICPGDDELVSAVTAESSIKKITWGRKNTNTVKVQSIDKMISSTRIQLKYKSGEFDISIPFTDDASAENAITCCCVLLYLGISTETISSEVKHLQPVNMRLELKKGINHCSIINDSYSADTSSLEIALNFLDQQSAAQKRTVILSDLLQTATPGRELYLSVLNSLKEHRVNRLIGIGERISKELQHELINANEELVIELYPSTSEYLHHFRSSDFKEEVILVKGARIFGFENIVQVLEQKVHQTVLEINLNGIVHNLKQYQQLLKPSTKVMAMVKAFAYGSGGAEIAGILQYHKVDYLGVAYADEGVELRRAGISLPIMVMNPEESSFDSIVDYNLEPELYSFELLSAFDSFLRREGLQQYPVHLEIETGMNRLGFALSEIGKLGDLLNTSSFKIQTVFSHLAGSEDTVQDEFTMEQFRQFQIAVKLLAEKIGYSFISHISNSAAILRHPLLQLDMVRLGIGLYGVDSAATGRLDLFPVTTLKSTVAQVKYLKAGESVSYNRKGVVSRDSVIATVRIGYADGYPRRLGNAAGKMLINGKLAPVIGTVCMDMTMLDVTDIPGVKEGDDVIVFGKELPVQQVAEWAQTIPYEIMTGVSQRVKRVYFEE